MITTKDIETITTRRRSHVLGRRAEIDSVRQVYLDAQSGEPTLVLAGTGISATSESFVPPMDATMEGNDLHVPYSTDQVKNAHPVRSAAKGPVWNAHPAPRRPQIRLAMVQR